MENIEKDLVVFEDDNGNEFSLEVLDYLNYEGKEYAVLAELEENENGQREAYVMEIQPVGDDMEEFVPVDEALAAKLIDIIENSDFDYDDDEEFEDEE